MIRTVLVAGLEMPDNNIVKFCEDNWLRPYHMGPSEYKREVPVCDAAIICYQGIDHNLSPKVLEKYKSLDRPIFHLKGGISSIKTQFEKEVYGEKNLAALKKIDIGWWKKFAFLVGRFYQKGEVIDYAAFRERFEKLTGLDSKSNFSTFLNHHSNVGKSFELVKRGRWRFLGLTDRMYDDMVKGGMFLEKTETFEPRVEVQAVDAPIPEEPKQELILASSMAVEVKPVHAEIRDFNAAMDIFLENVQNLRSENAELRSIIGQMSQGRDEFEERLVKRIRKDVESTVNVHMRLFSMAPRLKGKDAEQLDQFNKLLDFAEGWKPMQNNPLPGLTAPS
jgi:regulator of replication initiation timing